MRARVLDGKLWVDALHNPDEVAKVVRLALAAGLTRIEINQRGEDNYYQVVVCPEEGAWAGLAFPGMVAVVAELSDLTPEVLLERFRADSQFDVTKDLIGRRDLTPPPGA